MKFLSSLFLIAILNSLVPVAQAAAPEITPAQVVSAYADQVLRSYEQSLADARALQRRIGEFLASPSEARLAAARQAWLASRVSYGQTEVYRFYGGPIDFVDEKTGEEGPEVRVNAWPLNEAYLDYVKDSPQAGIIHDPKVALTLASLKASNMAKDEADVSTGYHAIEFLLWGQDFSAVGPGTRPASDYLPGEAVRDRRRQVLTLVTELLVQDLTWLQTQWQPAGEHYRQTFLKLPPAEALGKIVSGMATLAGFELMSERLAVALESGDQEDEQSCFSDNTHHDFIYDVLGIRNCYFGVAPGQPGVGALVAAKDVALHGKLVAAFDQLDRNLAQLPVPFDQVLASPKESPQRVVALQVVKDLGALTDLLRAVGPVLHIQVVVSGE